MSNNLIRSLAYRLWIAVSDRDVRHMESQGGASLHTRDLIGTYRCTHESHSLGLPCLRPWTWDGYCTKHNRTCSVDCGGPLGLPTGIRDHTFRRTCGYCGYGWVHRSACPLRRQRWHRVTQRWERTVVIMDDPELADHLSNYQQDRPPVAPPESS